MTDPKLSLAKLNDEEIIEKLKNKEIPIELFKKLSHSENWEIRKAIALNEDTPHEILENLSDDEDNDVKDAVTYRELPKEWRYLEDEEKINKLKEEEDIDFEIINILSKSNNELLRRIVALCPSTPSKILEKFIKDDDDDNHYVKDAIEFRKLSKEWRYLEDEEKINKLKEEEDIDSEVINMLSKSNNMFLRMAVAIHQSTKKDILLSLSNDEEWDVKDAIDFRELPKEWKYLDSYEKVDKLQESENIDEKVLKILSKSRDFSIRLAVAENKLTPISILQKLQNDDDDDVREAAKKSLKK